MNKELFEKAAAVLRGGENLVIAEITGSSGSTPRGPGARMLVGRGGLVCGTIGGGLCEHLAIEKAKLLLAERRGGSETYALRPAGSSAAGGVSVNAVCGGEITVVFHFFASGDGAALETFAADAARAADHSGTVYVFGAGHVARELVPLLARLDFRCVVFDDRADFCSAGLFPGADGVIIGSYENLAASFAAGSAYAIGPDDRVIILTRGHEWDFHAGAFALKTPACYIGVIGSRAKHKAMREKLLAAGFTAAELDAPRVHAPVGLPIGSKTPAEVAVSIAAELVKERSAALK